MSYAQIGLILDIFGAIIIFFFGVPSNAVTIGHKSWHDFVARVGLVLLIAGFSMQLVSSFR